MIGTTRQDRVSRSLADGPYAAGGGIDAAAGIVDTFVDRPRTVSNRERDFVGANDGGVKIDSCEDDLSALIRELLVSRVQFLGVVSARPAKGGFTAKGNPGERDLLLQKGSTTLAVIEAVVCGASVPKQKLTSHFPKAFWVLDMPPVFFISPMRTAKISLPSWTISGKRLNITPAGFKVSQARRHPPH